MNMILKFSAMIQGLTLLLCNLHVFSQQKMIIASDNKIKNNLDQAVDAAAKKYLSLDNTHGVSIDIYQKGEKYIYNYSKDSLTDAQSYYNIGSVAKTFVTTMLAEAILEHKIGLDDDIRKHLSDEYPNLTFKGQAILVKHLANHTSALPKVFRVYPSKITDSLRQLPIQEQVSFFARYDRDSLLSDLHQVRPDTILGTKYSYNSSAMMLLVALLERVYQQPYAEIVTAYLRRHLNMEHTAPYLNQLQQNRAAQGHDPKGRPVAFANLRGFYFGPTMNSTIPDMLSYLEANLTLKDPAIRLTHQLTFGQQDGFGVGLGWMINTNESGERYFYHDGNTKIGYNTLCLMYPVTQYGIIIIVNDTIDQHRVGMLENEIRTALHNN